MPLILNERESIYNPKTREYFKEVESSYANGNYRSANVMLYSVAICDILFKLQELKDMYNDTIATEILATYRINSEDKAAKSKSAWEKDFIDSVHKKTELLDLEAYTHLNRLYEDRNFSAHPALNENFELISPSQETTIANIKNILNEILIKPPIFVTKVVDTFLFDLSEKKTIFNKEELSVYLKNKYFSRMTVSMKTSTFRSLWKLCFNLPDDENCKKNRNINRQALEVLSENQDINIEKIIKDESQFYLVSVDDLCEWNLVVYLSKFPNVYSSLEREVKVLLDSYISNNYEAKLISWFKADNLSSHIDYLLSESFITISAEEIRYLEKVYKENGCLNRLTDFFIKYFSKSYSYDTANNRYESTILPFLDLFSKEQFDILFECINNNNQIYNRSAAYQTNTLIIKKFIEKFGFVYNSDIFENIRFDKDILVSESDEDEFIESDWSEDVPF